MTVTVAVEADAAIDLLQKLSTTIGSDAVMRFLGERLQEYEQTLFATSGAGQWAALDPSTVREKASSRVLVDEGDLMAQLTSGRVDVSGDSVTVKTDDVAAIMAARGARGMPVRDPAIVPPTSVVAQWADDLVALIVDGVV